MSFKEVCFLCDKCCQWLVLGKDLKYQLVLIIQEMFKLVMVQEVIEYWICEYVEENCVNVEWYKVELCKYIYFYIGKMVFVDCEI